MRRPQQRCLPPMSHYFCSYAVAARSVIASNCWAAARFVRLNFAQISFGSHDAVGSPFKPRPHQRRWAKAGPATIFAPNRLWKLEAASFEQVSDFLSGVLLSRQRRHHENLGHLTATGLMPLGTPDCPNHPPGNSLCTRVRRPSARRRVRITAQEACSRMRNGTRC